LKDERYESRSKGAGEMDKKIKDAIIGIILGIIFGVAGALFLQWRLEKQMERRGYKLSCYWEKQ